MPEATATSLLRQKRSILWLLGGLSLLLLSLLAFQFIGNVRPIEVSPQTTHITEPLRSNGLPDYEKYLLELCRRGTTRENNAAVPLLQALFPSGLDPNQAKLLAAALGMKRLPLPGPSLESVDGDANQGALWQWMVPNWPNQRNFSDVDAWAERMTGQAVWRPWSTEQMPPLAGWLARNEKSFRLIIEASLRPRYFNPSPTLLNNGHDLLIDATFPPAQSIYPAGRALLARAMWHVGEERPRDAWHDIHAIFRLSRLLYQGGTYAEHSKARDLHTMACYATQTLLDHARLTINDARRIYRDLIRLKPLSPGRSIDRDRLFALDALVYVASGGDPDRLGGLIDVYTMVFEMIEPASIDWRVVLRETNQWYDRLAMAESVSDRAARVDALATIKNDVTRRIKSFGDLGDFADTKLNRHERTQLFTSMMLSVLLSSFESGLAAEDRANAKLELTCIAAALAIYRAQHNRYPQKLDDLVPRVLNELPRDRFHSKPYIYQPEGQGYLLYSTGGNGVDDNGRYTESYFLESPPFDERGRTGRDPFDVEEPARTHGDDISIRVPRPPLESPKTLTPADQP